MKLAAQKDTSLCCRPLRGTPTAHPQPPEFWPVDALELAETLLAVGRGRDST